MCIATTKGDQLTPSVEVSSVGQPLPSLTCSDACALRYRGSPALPTRVLTPAPQDQHQGADRYPRPQERNMAAPRTTPVILPFQSRGSVPTITPSAARTRG
jgi:hypothetical protein